MRGTLLVAAALVALPAHAGNIARADDCTVRVDSSYSGYAPETLTDGIEVVAGAEWTLAGWASKDEPGEHWIELSWPEEREVHEVVVYWALDQGFRRSREVHLQVREGEGWRRLIELGGGDPAACDSFVADPPVRTSALRLLQPEGQGPPGRPDIMWVGEVQAFGPPFDADDRPAEEAVQLQLAGGSSDVTFLSRGPAGCVVSEGDSEIARVHSRADEWTDHHLVIDGAKGTPVTIEGAGGTVIADASVERREAAAAADGEPIAELKDMHIETPLHDAVIAMPENDRGEEWARQVQDAVREACGLEPTIMPAADARDQMAARTVIGIGNALNNAVIELLYDRGFVYADRLYPGEGGYAVRTVHNPLGTGYNVVTASGSDAEGTALAVECLCEHIREAAAETLPRILDIQLGPPQSRPGPPTQDAIDARVASYLRLRESGDAPEWALNNFAGYGIRYNRTGDEEWAEMYRALMLALVGYWDEHGPWPMEWLWDPYWAWDNAEEAPCFTDDERLRITNFLLDVGRTDRTRYAGAFTGRNEISGGHQLDQNLCLFVLGDYFWKYYRHPEAREWLDVVDWRFTTSARYHRLRHDANDYNHAAYWFLLRYARISGDWTYVENGQFGRFVMYTQMMLDNLGYRAQNGDAGSPFAGPQGPMYSMASWLYHDGRYKWAIRDRQVTEPGYYANEIEPVEPDELLGLYRFDIDPTFYRYLSGHDAGAEDLPPQIVPIEETWDKISFREAFDPDAQYFILDGMTAGEHGHDDANAVIRFTDNGRIWLVDCDYIRRAPKWHNSAVVIRDGASAPQPPLARCDHLHDFGDVALVRTTLPHYTGTDWERNIFWRKGEYAVFIDNFVAREPGDYRLKTIWRTLGRTQIEGGRLHVRQAGAADQFAAFRPDRDQDRNGIPDGFSASFTNKWGETKAFSALDTEVYHSEPPSVRIECDPNGYAVIWAFWPVTGGERYRFHTMCRTETTAGCSASTTIYWTGAGRNRLPQSAGGGPQSGPTDWRPMDIEDTAPEDAETAQVCIRLSAQGSDTGSGVCWFDDLSLVQIAEDGAETVLFPADKAEEVTSDFTIANADGARLHLSSFLQRGHPRRDGYWVGYQYAAPEVKTLQQIADAPLQTGEARAFLNLLYTSDEQEPRELTIRSLGPTAALIEGGETPAAAAVRPADGGPILLGPLSVDAEMAFVQGGRLYAAGLTRVAVDGREVFSADEPADRKVELPRPDLVAAVPVPIQPERMRPPAFEASGSPAPAAVQLGGEVKALCRADLTGDGAEETIAGAADGTVSALSDADDVLWTFEAQRSIRQLRAADVTGDGRPEVLVGGDDQRVRLLDASGHQLWEHEFEDFHSRDGRVVAMDVGDLAGDGQIGIVVGTEAWHWYALDAAGTQLWRTGHAHATTTGRLADLDGDGDLELVTGTEYYGWPIYDHAGRRLWNMRGGPGVAALEVADLDGDGKMESLFGTCDCAASLRCMDPGGAELWRRSLGDEPRAIATVDLDGDGSREVVASSDAMFLYAFSADGEPLWRIDTGDIIDLLAVRGDHVVCGSRDGLVHVVGTGGEIAVSYACGSPVTALQVAGEAIIAGLADGRVLWLRQPLSPPAPTR